MWFVSYTRDGVPGFPYPSPLAAASASRTRHGCRVYAGRLHPVAWMRRKNLRRHETGRRYTISFFALMGTIAGPVLWRAA